MNYKRLIHVTPPQVSTAVYLHAYHLNVAKLTKIVRLPTNTLSFKIHKLTSQQRVRRNLRLNWEGDVILTRCMQVGVKWLGPDCYMHFLPPVLQLLLLFSHLFTLPNKYFWCQQQYKSLIVWAWNPTRRQLNAQTPQMVGGWFQAGRENQFASRLAYAPLLNLADYFWKENFMER